MKNSSEDAALRLYGTLLAHIRQPVFYRSLQVPDSFSGRFDLLVAHVFLVINRLLDHKTFNQALFDALFADMDQTLREQGVGDMGVPKHMKRMMKGFNGRMLAYKAALAQGDALQDIIRRNIYGTVPDAQNVPADALAAYMRKVAAALETQQTEALLAGFIELPVPEDVDAG